MQGRGLLYVFFVKKCTSMIKYSKKFVYLRSEKFKRNKTINDMIQEERRMTKLMKLVVSEMKGKRR